MEMVEVVEFDICGVTDLGLLPLGVGPILDVQQRPDLQPEFLPGARLI